MECVHKTPSVGWQNDTEASMQLQDKQLAVIPAC